MNAVRRWRPLLRLAWRDAVRNKARAALVLTLIALPVAAVTAADVLYQTQDISGAEALDRRLGGADAELEVYAWAGRVLQWPDPERGWTPSGGEGVEQVPSLEVLGAAVGRSFRGIQRQSGEVRVETAGGVSAVEADELDLRDPLTRGLFTVERGRAPIAADEVVVNGELADRGPGLGDSLQIADGPSLTVVGVGESTSTYGYPLVVGLPEALGLRQDPGSATWLVDAGGPITWAQVQRLNELGVVVTSRDVLLHPPADADVAPQLAEMAGQQQSQTLAIAGLIVAMVLLEVVLLAGPAFAVGARRRSRSLALMAATGGTPAQTRRAVLSSALVLGSLGAVLGVAVGLLAAWATQPLAQRLTRTWFGPYDVSWAQVGVVAAFGLLSALLASMVPAWLASRQDVVAVLAGRRGDRKAGLRSPLVGLVLLAGGVAGSAYGARASGNGELLIGFSALVAVLGMILLVPVALALLARGSGRLPLALRFAVRDAARHRSRTVPAVAAVAATVAGVVALGIASASDAKENRETYRPTLVAGDGIVTSYEARPADWAPMRQAVERELPDATVVDVQGVPEGVVSASTFLTFGVDDRRDLLYTYGGNLGASVLVAEQMPALPAVSPEQRAAADRALSAGGAAVFVNEVVEAASTRVSGERYDEDGEPSDKIKRHDLPAAFVTVPTSASVPQAVLSPAAARELDVEVGTVGLFVTGTTVTAEQEQTVNEAIGAVVPFAGLYVERGFQAGDDARILLWILGVLGGVLMLGGTLTTTYLALSDARPDLATLGAVGAAPRTRRAVAGCFAVVVALVGGVVGAVVGFVPGIAVTYPLTSTGPSYAVEGGGDGGGLVSGGFNLDQFPQSGPFLEIPWLLIGTLVIALPLLTGLMVAATTRSRLPLVARLD